MNRTRGISLVFALSAVGAMAVAVGVRPGVASAAKTAKKKIDPEADRLLRQMTDYLAGLKVFKVRSGAVDEVVTRDGQKIQVLSESDVSVERPNKLRSEQVGAKDGLAFWYDGQTMTLECKANNTYATVPAPASIDDTIDKARKQFQIEAPGADLLYSHPYEVLTEQVTGGKFIAKENIDGFAVNHLAFQGDEVDYQLWIQDGAQPLPMRFVITSKKVKGSPEFAVRLSNWQLQPNLVPNNFVFQPPAGAQKVASFPSLCGVAGR